MASFYSIFTIIKASQKMRCFFRLISVYDLEFCTSQESSLLKYRALLLFVKIQWMLLHVPNHFSLNVYFVFAAL